jgi:hypothetical protein
MTQLDLDAIEARAKAAKRLGDAKLASRRHVEMGEKFLVLSQDIFILTLRVQELEDALAKCLVAFQLTREYVGEDVLPELPGWSWFDAVQNADRVLRGES